MNKIWKIVLVMAVVIAIIGLFTPTGKNVKDSVLGQITDTSFFDYFDASTGYKVSGSNVMSGTQYLLGSYAETPLSTSFTTSTDTPCIIISPSATSTLISAVAQFTSATGTDLFVQWGKAASGDSESHATSTALTSEFVIDNTGDDIPPILIASSSPLTGYGYIFAPSTNLVLKVAAKNVEPSGSKVTMSLTGTCKTKWLTN
jgi:hypothetical protein